MAANPAKSLDALAKPANTISSNLPKQAINKPQKTQPGPSAFKATTPQPSLKGKGKNKGQKPSSGMQSILGGY